MSINVLGGMKTCTIKVKPRQAIEAAMEVGAFYTMHGRNMTFYGTAGKIGRWMCEYYERTEDGFQVDKS